MAKLPPAKMVRLASTRSPGTLLLTHEQAIASLEAQQDLPFVVYDRVVAEPTEASWRDAIAWARQEDCSHFLACVTRHLRHPCLIDAM